MLAKGTRIELHAAHDLWMRGARFGEIVGLSRTREYRDAFTGEITKTRPYRVKLDNYPKVIRVHPDDLFPIT